MHGLRWHDASSNDIHNALCCRISRALAVTEVLRHTHKTACSRRKRLLAFPSGLMLGHSSSQSAA